MTQAAVTPYVFHTTDAAEDTFSFPFHIDAASELKAYLDENAVSNFTVSGVGTAGGGTITFDSPPAAGVLFLYRATPQDQLTDYVANDPFSAQSHEAALDHIVRMIQDISESLSRRPALAQYTAQALRNLSLPLPGAGKAIGWNQAGTGLVLYDTEDLDSIAEEELIHRDGSVAYTGPADFGSQALTRIGSANAQMLSGTANPSVSPGVAAPVTTLYLRDNAATDGPTEPIRGQLWLKRGPADTAWTMVAPWVVTLDDFGAVPDGTTDCSAAFAAADAFFKGTDPDLGNGVIFIPPQYGASQAGPTAGGRGYRLDQSVTLTRSNLLGMGTASVIVFGGASNQLRFQPDGDPPFDEFEIACESITFRTVGGLTRTGNVPLFEIVNDTTFYRVTHCRFSGPHDGVYLKITSGRHCSVLNNDFFLGDDNVTAMEVNGSFTRIAYNSLRKVGAGTGVTGILLGPNAAQTTIGPNTRENLNTYISNPNNVLLRVVPEMVQVTETWDPPNGLADGTNTSTGFTLPGGAIPFGSDCSVSASPDLPDGMFVLGRRDEGNTDRLRVTLYNFSGSSQDLGPLTLTILITHPSMAVVSGV